MYSGNYSSGGISFMLGLMILAAVIIIPLLIKSIRDNMKESRLMSEIHISQYLSRDPQDLIDASRQAPSTSQPELNITRLYAPPIVYCRFCGAITLRSDNFCQMCGKRLKSPKPVPSESISQKAGSCIICYESTCPTCDSDIEGQHACFEVCPHCERSYHKHCWDKTIEFFGKCGFCLEIP